MKPILLMGLPGGMKNLHCQHSPYSDSLFLQKNFIVKKQKTFLLMGFAGRIKNGHNNYYSLLCPVLHRDALLAETALRTKLQ